VAILSECLSALQEEEFGLRERWPSTAAFSLPYSKKILLAAWAMSSIRKCLATRMVTKNDEFEHAPRSISIWVSEAFTPTSLPSELHAQLCRPSVGEAVKKASCLLKMLLN